MSNLIPLDSFFNSLYATNLFLFIIIIFFLANMIFKIYDAYNQPNSLIWIIVYFACSIFFALVVMLFVLMGADSLIEGITASQIASGL